MHISPQQAYFILAEHKYQKAFTSVAVLRSFAPTDIFLWMKMQEQDAVSF